MVSEGIARGYVRPLSRVTYSPNEVTSAFRLLNASSHRGRVLLRMTGHTIETDLHRYLNDFFFILLGLLPYFFLSMSVPYDSTPAGAESC